MFPRFFAILALCAAAPCLAVPAGEKPEIELFISGASAQDELLENVMRIRSGVDGIPNICAEGTLDIYRTVIAGTSKRVFYCRTSENIPGVEPGRRLAVHKSSGGSGEGAGPLVFRELIPFIDLASIAGQDGCKNDSRIVFTGNLAGYTNHTFCRRISILAAPSVGISDVEPALLGRISLGLTLTSMSQLVWGMPVSKNFRNALQAIQGLVPSSVAHDSPVREIEDNMPSLTTQQIASIFAGTIVDWNQLYDADGTGLSRSASLPGSPPGRPNLSGTTPGAYRPDASTGDKVYICRRIRSSGTQASYEVHYLRQRCLPAAPGFVDPDDGSSLNDGGDPAELVRRDDPKGRVFAGVGTSDVRACLDAHDDHNRWAIGMFSTENIGNNSGKEFRHIKVDGHAPTLLNAHLGRWGHISEPSLQWRTEDAENFMATEAGMVWTFIMRNFGLPQVLSSVNMEFRHPWGQGGYLAIPKNEIEMPELPVNDQTMARYPISSLSKTNNDAVDNCNLPLIRGASSVSGY
jgi:hypothetical protein